MRWAAANREKARAAARKWKAKKRLEQRAYMLEYRAANREKLKQQKTSWRIRNPERFLITVRARSKRYRARYPEKCAQQHAKWAAANKHLRLAATNRRRAAKLNATPSWADQQLIELIYAEGRHRGLEVDHIIPLQGDSVCGLHVHYNMQLLTGRQNRAKGNRL